MFICQPMGIAKLRVIFLVHYCQHHLQAFYSTSEYFLTKIDTNLILNGMKINKILCTFFYIWLRQMQNIFKMYNILNFCRAKIWIEVHWSDKNLVAIFRCDAFNYIDCAIYMLNALHCCWLIKLMEIDA